MQTMPPLRILVFDCPARQVQFGIKTWDNIAGACCRIASVTDGSSSLSKKCTRPNKSILAGTGPSSGEAWRARTGMSWPMCLAAAGPAFLNNVSKTCRLALRSSHNSHSAFSSNSASLVLKCSSYNCRRVRSHNEASSSMLASTEAASHSSPDRMRKRRSKMRGHSAQQDRAPARSNDCTAPKIHGRSSSLCAPSSKKRTTIRTSLASSAGGAGRMRCASTAKTWRRCSALMAVKFFT
mmetsp:Transcript_41468/g.119550  ORF Transcript_41468/g.119550 Transcript_41468/m.119550 type:complete len:238 (+) Transcript_41468:724-1437(+)